MQACFISMLKQKRKSFQEEQNLIRQKDSLNQMTLCLKFQGFIFFFFFFLIRHELI